jgi:hypothetical protein
MAVNREDAMKKILKLVETANRSREMEDDDSGIDHDALSDNATRKISKIMRIHQINETDLAQYRADRDADGAEFVHFKFFVPNSYGLGKERANALHWAVIVPFGGSSMKTYWKSAKMDTEMTVFAPRSIAEMMKALLYSISLQMEEGLKTSSKAERQRLDRIYYLSQSDRNREILQFRRGYLRAFGATVGSRVQAAQQEAMDEVKRELEEQGQALSSSTELVLAESSGRASTFMNVWYTDSFGGKKLKINSNRARASAEGRKAGWKDGARADIEPPKADHSRRMLVVG